jgi:apolipoprotein N-acyltransferase
MARTENRSNNKGSLHQNDGENPSPSHHQQLRWWQWIIIGLIGLVVFWLVLLLLFYGGGGLVMGRIRFLLGLALFLFTASVAGIVIALREMRRRR